MGDLPSEIQRQEAQGSPCNSPQRRTPARTAPDVLARRHGGARARANRLEVSQRGENASKQRKNKEHEVKQEKNWNRT